MSQQWNLPSTGTYIASLREKVVDALESVWSAFSGTDLPANPAPFQTAVRTGKSWAFQANSGASAWLALYPVGASGGLAFTLQRWITYQDLNIPRTLAILPAPHLVWSAWVIVDAGFSGGSGGAHTISLGYAGAETGYVNAANVAAVSAIEGGGTLIKKYGGLERTVQALYTFSGTGSPSAGKALCVVHGTIVPVRP